MDANIRIDSHISNSHSLVLPQLTAGSLYNILRQEVFDKGKDEKCRIL